MLLGRNRKDEGRQRSRVSSLATLDQRLFRVTSCASRTSPQGRLRLSAEYVHDIHGPAEHLAAVQRKENPTDDA
jgi:hypothetical protein